MKKYITGHEHEYLPPDLPEEESEIDKPTMHSGTDIIRYITGVEADEVYGDIPVPNQVEEKDEHEILIGHDDQVHGSPRATRITISSWEPDIIEIPGPVPNPQNEPQEPEDLEDIAKQYKSLIP